MRIRPLLILLLFFFSCLGPLALSQNQPSPDARKIVQKIMPAYPDIAKRMKLSGSVKVLVTVEPDGKVKTIQPVGGSPVLIQAAEDAVYKWRFASSNGETKELIELHFDGAQ